MIQLRKHEVKDGAVSMTDADKPNLLYFESPSMRGLHERMSEWQAEDGRHLFSVSIQQDGGKYCAIALAGPAEVVITSTHGKRHAIVSENGRLYVYASDYS
jgi:hypothetical protein